MARRPRARGRSDPLRLDVFHHLFASVAEEMGATLQRSSFSPNIRERRDFSCALFDGEGRMIGQASHLPIHLGSTPMSVAAAIERVEMGPGDAVLLNDPYAGGTHLPDLTLVSPVFLPGERRPSFFSANRAHHADVGGAEPGSMTPTSDVHGEGLRIPPVRLVRGGRVDRSLLDLVLANMRVPREREGDLLAQWSTNRVGEARLLAMVEEVGARELVARARELMDWTERLTRELVSSLPDGSWTFEDELEDDGSDAGPAHVRLTLSKRRDELVCDFRGTDARPGSSLNATRAVTMSAVFYVLRLLLPPGTPTNDGILRPVRVRTRPGTLVDAVYPSGVAAGNVETSQRLVDVLLGALAEVPLASIPAASAGTMSNLTFGGPVPEARRGRERASGAAPYAYYETVAGGAGAGPDGPGAHALQTHMTNTRNTPIEELETSYPARLLACTLRRGSGGAGRERGGDGVEKRLRFLEPAHVSFTAERQARGPWGRAGGGAGASGSFRTRLPGGRWRRHGGRVSCIVPAGGEVEVRTPGGGGFGSPGRVPRT
jgi:N-methylhydantoinase B